MRVEVSPLMTATKFAGERRGTSVRRSDMRSVYGGEDVEAVLPSGELLFRLVPSSLSAESRRRLVDSFARAALLGDSNRKSVVRNDARDPRGSLLAGAFDGRDVAANTDLRERAKRSVPPNPARVCRTTPFQIKNPKKWANAKPAVAEIAGLHARADPRGWSAQTSFVGRVLEEYRIGDGYTTLTANYNSSTAIHNDAENFSECTTALAVVGRDFRGGELVFPRFGVAVRLAPGDILFFSGKEWHGNAPITVSGSGFRLSVLLYARRGLEKCTRIIDPRNNLGVAWTPTSHDTRFLQFLKALAAYEARTGRIPPVGAREGSLMIGEWVRARRREWSAGKLSAARADMLESVPGWTWTSEETSLASAREAKRAATEDRTSFATRALGAYVARYGHRPRAREVVWNLMLNKWVDNRRQDARRGAELAPDLLTLLGKRAPRPFVRGAREEFEVAVPTFRREDAIKRMTLAMLRANRIAPGSVTLFVASASQAKAYAASLSGGEFAVFADRIVVGGAGVRAARNAIRAHFEPGTHVVSIDDDVRAVLAARKGAFANADVRDIVRDGALACDVYGAKLWGLYPVKNTYFMGARPFAGLAFVQGQFFGCVVDRDPAMTLDLEIKEDHENTLNHYVRDGVVARLEYAVADSVMYETPGGIQATTLRTVAKNRRAAEKLKARFGDLVTLFVRKSTGMTEIRYAKQEKTTNTADVR